MKNIKISLNTGYSKEIQEILNQHQIKDCSAKDRNSKELSTFFEELKINY